MKKECLYLAMTAAMFTACSSDVELGSSTQSAQTVDNAISFQFINRNSITSRGTEDAKLLNNNGHYNFGVFAYKTISTSTTQIMDNYLVGYGSKSTEPAAGYKLDQNSQTTWDKSQWAYEKLGSSEYTYDGTDGYYKASEDFYKSNNANQYLKYWDKSSTQTDFYAYAPYLHGTSTATASVSTTGTTTTITFPMTDGYDDASKYDFIAAHKKVENKDYENSVQIEFKRLSAMIRIGFYEEVAGYKVKILKLDSEKHPSVGVSAAPAKYESTQYKYGTLYYEGTGTGTYVSSDFTTKVSGKSGSVYSTGTGSTHSYLNFDIPSLADDAYISTEKSAPSMSDTKYYLIPDNGTNKTGLTFHVTYQLIADDTNETITVYNATVHVPYEEGVNTYCDWKSNYVYTYIFKITKNTSGSTDKPEIDPSSPDASDKEALLPIIFDGCTVEDMTEATKQEFDIN